MISSGSFSRLQVFEQCKFRAHLQYELKIAEPERPLPAGKSEHANDRGTRIHTGAELFVQDKAELLPELSKFATELEHLRDLYKEGKVSIEGEWGFNRDWEPCEWRGAWLRMKLDAMVHVSPTEAIVIDYKSGAKFGKEIQHGEQGQMYQLGTFLKYPKLENLTVEFWYTDQDDITSKNYRRDQGLRFKTRWNSRLEKLTSCVEFPPNPNKFNCKWCWFSNRPGGTGHCSVGVW